MISRQQLEQLAAALEGIPVFGCLPNSSAARAGIRYGDIVLSANGLQTRKLEDYVLARQLIEDRVELVLFRDGAEFKATLACVAPAEEADPLAGLEAISSFFGPHDQFGAPATTKSLPS